MKKRSIGVFTLLLLSSLIAGCGATAKGSLSKTNASSTTASIVKLQSSSITDASQSEITVKATIQNTTEKAISLQPSELALISSATVLSPSSKSQIPSQIPADSNVQLTILFDNNGQISNGDDAKLGFQPDTNQAEQFVPLGKIAIKDGANTASTASSQTSASTASTSIAGPIVSLLQSDGSKVTLPVVGLKTMYGVDMNPAPSVNPPTALPDVTFDIPSDQAKQLSGYWVNEGDDVHGELFIGPAGWVPTKSAIGADGSELVTLQSPSDITDKLTYASAGGCAGCAIGDIGTYFPSMRSWASQQGFQPDFMTFISEDLLNANTIAYAIDPMAKGYETNGVAKMQTSGNIFFNREEVTLPSSQHRLASTILNFYAKTTP